MVLLDIDVIVLLYISTVWAIGIAKAIQHLVEALKYHARHVSCVLAKSVYV